MNPELVQAVRDKKAILFVGAGVSQNLGLPGFGQLTRHLATELGFDPDIFETQGDYLTLAEYYKLEKGSIGPLRSWIDRTWHAGVDIGASPIHKAIVELEFPIIYTTNYDSWLERAHERYAKRYTKITSVGDLTRLEPGVVQIVKFHGDCDDDESIVLTESSYFARLDFEAPLDIKLRSDLLGKSVLFIGYSLSDINLRYMLFKLDRQWRAAGTGSTRPRSFMYLTRPNLVQERVLESRGIEPVVSTSDKSGDGLLLFLNDLLSNALGRATAL